MTLRECHALKNFVRKAGGVFREVISKLILGVILHQLRELYLEKKHPPFLKGGRGIKKRLIIPLNPLLGKGDLYEVAVKIR